jgi:hypothetical protein
MTPDEQAQEFARLTAEIAALRTERSDALLRVSSLESRLAAARPTSRSTSR